MKVTHKWQTDSKLSVIYALDGEKLGFYSKKNDPNFDKLQDITEEEFIASNPYKNIPFNWDNIPDEAYMDLGWSWS